MRKKLLIFCLFSFSLLLVQCRLMEKKQQTATEQYEELEEEEFENEDGIREAQEMDFEMTRDNRLGYVPVSRLVDAYNKITMERRAGRYARISSLNWIERGPNTNATGPSNGNIRGPLNNAVVSGRMRAIHVDLNDPTNKTVWAASVSGGLWKTNDITANPANWILVNDFLGNLAISSITQSPANKNILYFATGERNNNIDAVRGGGVWKSVDGGATWNLLTNTTGFWNTSKIVCDAAGNVYVGTNGNNLGLQRSTNEGASWTNITPANSGNSNRITDIKLSNTGRLHVTMSGTNEAGSYFTDNPATVASATWSAPITPIPNLNQNCEIAVSGNVLYALPEVNSLTPAIYKSTDGGLNWAATITSPPGTTSGEPTINSGQAWFNLAIGIDPNNPDICVAGGLNFYRTTNGGASWTQITRWVGNTFNYVHADHHGVFWNGTQVLLATDGGIFYSNDNGVSYTDRNVGMRTLQFYSCAIHPTNNYYLGGTQDNGSHSVTATSGIGGSIEVHGGDGGYTHIDEDEPLFQFSATVFSNYRRSTNGGVNWSSISLGNTGQFINPTDYDDINNRMYCTGGAGTYIRWDNPQNGSTFNTINISGVTPNSVRSFKVSPFTANRVFMGTAGGAVLRVDNAHLSAPGAVNITGAGMPQTNGNIVSCVNTGTADNFLIASYSNYGVPHVWVSTDAGASWSNVNGNLPDIPVRWAMFYPEDNGKAIIATEMGIFETTQLNGSSTSWVQNGTFPSVKTNMLQYRVSDRTILAATHGRGFWTTTIPAVNPTVRFASTYNYSRANAEGTTATDGCRGYRDITVNMLVDAAPSGTATVTLNVGGSSTAAEGVDFDITTNGNFTSPSKTLQFPGGSTSVQPITVRIYDDAAVEGNEFFVLNYTVSGSTNAVAAPNSSSYTINISDNDVVPQPTTFANYTVGTNAFGGYVQPLRGEFAKARSQYLYRADELTAAGITAGTISSLALNVTSKASTQPYNGFNISLKTTTSADMSGGLETGFTLCHSSTHSSTVGVNTFNFNQGNFIWDGVSNIIVEICFDNSSGSGSDNVASSTTAYQSGIWGRGNFAVPGCSIDGNITTLFSSVGANNDRVRPDITLGITSATAIETVAGRNKANFVGGASSSYFLSQGFANLMGVAGNAAAPLGCVNFTIQEAGTNWQNYYGGQRSQKVFDVSLTTNPSATYTIGFYYTAAELGGKTPSALSIGRTTASTLAGANNTNTTVFGTTVSGFGSDYLFTATVSGDGRYFLTDGSVTTSVIDVTRSGETFVKLMQNPIRSNVMISISNEQRRNINASLFTSNGQLIRSWNLGKAAGPTELSLSGTTLGAGTYILRVFADNRAQSIKLVKN